MSTFGYKNIIDCKRINNIFNIISDIEAHITSNKYINIEDKLYVFGICDENFKYSKDGINELLYLSKIHNASFCILYNKCNLYDNFRLKIDYTILFLAKKYNCNIITNRELDFDYTRYGQFPYACTMFANGEYLPINIIDIFDNK